MARPRSQPCPSPLRRRGRSWAGSAPGQPGSGQLAALQPASRGGKASSPNHKPALARERLRLPGLTQRREGLGSRHRLARLGGWKGSAAGELGFATPAQLGSGKARIAWARLPGHVPPAAAALAAVRSQASPGHRFPGSGERLVQSQGWGLVREGGEGELKEVENGKFGFLFFTWRSAACQSPRGSPPPRSGCWNSRTGAVTVLGAA